MSRNGVENMTRKDYQLVANILNKWILRLENGDYTVAYEHSSDPDASTIFDAFASKFEERDEKFNREEFIQECIKNR